MYIQVHTLALLLITFQKITFRVISTFIPRFPFVYLVFAWKTNLWYMILFSYALWAFTIAELQLSKYLNWGCIILFLYIFFSRAILELPWAREEKDDQNPKSFINLSPNSYHTFITLDESYGDLHAELKFSVWLVFWQVSLMLW